MHHNNIGTLRFIGAFLVLYGHGYTLSGGSGVVDPISRLIRDYTPFYLGLPGLGVAMFFVLSGYLVTASFARRNDLIDYSVARVLRIYPALIVAVLFCVLVVGLHVTTFSLPEYLQHKETWAFTLRNSALLGIHHTLPGVFTDLPWKDGVNGSLWTLPYEMLMYVFVAGAGICGLYKCRWRFNAFAILVAASLIGFPSVLPALQRPGLIFPAMAFLFGAFLFVNRAQLKLNGVTLSVLLALAIATYGTPAFNSVSLFCFASCTLALGMQQRVPLPALDKHGDFSYGLYLYAFPLQQLAIHYLGGNNPSLINLIAFVGAMTLAVASWNWVEKPCLTLKQPLSANLKTRLARFSTA